MLQRQYLSCILLLVVLALRNAEPSLASAPEAMPVAAQQEPRVHLSLAQSASFSDALDALAAQGHVAILAEGVPLVPRLSKKGTQDLTAPLPLSEAVTKVAASFDYDVQKQDDVFVLTKRYTNPKEIPCVTLEECDQAFRDILTLLEPFNPNLDERSDDHSQRSTVITFFNSLSPRQLQEVQAKTLRYGELGPDQQKMVESIFLFGFVQLLMDQLRDTVRMLDYAPKSVLTGQDKGHNALFIEAPMLINNSLRYFQPLEGGISAPGQSTPLILPKQAETGSPPVPSPMTLETLVGLLPHTGPPATVDTPLKDKPVFAAGLKNVSSGDVLRALKVLYNLRIGASDAGGEELMRQIIPPTDSLRDLGPHVWSLLPVSLIRAIHQEDAPTGQAIPVAENKTEDRAEAFRRFSAEADRRFRQQMQSRRLLPALWTEAVHQVLVGVQPQLRSGGLSVRIPVKSLDGTTRSALAVALTVSALEVLQTGFTGQANRNTTDCLDDMDATLVYTVPTETVIINGRKVPSLYFKGTDPYTKEQVGLGGVRFGPWK